MDFGKAFTFITEDKEWFKKLIIGGLLLPWVVTSPALIGWMVEIIRRVQADHPTPLPDWQEFGKFYVDGLRVVGIGLIWSLPMILLISCSALILAFAGNSLETDAALVAMPISIICVSLFAILYSLVLLVITIPVPGLVAAGLPFAKIISPALSLRHFRANVSGFLIAGILGNLLANFIASIGSLACGIGILLTAPFGIAVLAHLLGQAHQQANTVLGTDTLAAEL